VLCGHDLCCAVGGSITCYTAGMISDFRFFPFVAVCENVHLLNLFETRPTPTFNIGLFSNLVFVHFLWNYNEVYNFCKRLIIVFPIRGRVRILYVLHHRARDGWMTELGDTCAQKVCDAPRDFRVLAVPACRCVVCVRQPPTLKATDARANHGTQPREI
jgi:hypothetical protein